MTIGDIMIKQTNKRDKNNGSTLRRAGEGRGGETESAPVRIPYLVVIVSYAF